MKIDRPQIGEPVLHTYKYDQLNRIKEVNNYNSYNPGNNTLTATNAHKELLSFDANGNIQTALLNGSSASLPYENFTYTYDGVKKNRLLSIHNSVGNVTSEYEYDAIGNVTKDELEGNENMTWNVYGKLKSLTKIGSGTAISFGYDASGNRISKKVGTNKKQWYIRDASGNIMATYIKENAINGGDLSTEMFNMYGSSMLGGWKLSVNMETVPPPANNGELERGNQEFYFSNHLGNNLVILNDRKEGVQDTGNPTQVTGYEPYVLSATDYSAYGENLIGREYNPGGIKFGFNGKWNDFETGYQDYGMRMSSSKRRGFVSVDPITKQYPELTPYQFSSNNPIEGIDLDGLEYVSSKEVRIEVIRGIVKLKVENMTSAVRKALTAYNNNSNFWNGGIGANLEVAKIDLLGTVPLFPEFDSDPSDGNPNYRSDQMTVGNPTTKSGLSDRRYKERTITTASPAGARGLAYLQIGMEVVKLSVNMYMQNSAKTDNVLIGKHMDALRSAAADVKYALQKGFIPVEFQTQEHISDIINAVLSGESYIGKFDETTGKQILKIAKEIYNTLSVKRIEYTKEVIETSKLDGISLKKELEIKNPEYDPEYVETNPPLED